MLFLITFTVASITSSCGPVYCTPEAYLQHNTLIHTQSPIRNQFGSQFQGTVLTVQNKYEGISPGTPKACPLSKIFIHHQLDIAAGNSMWVMSPNARCLLADTKCQVHTKTQQLILPHQNPSQAPACNNITPYKSG